MKKKITRKCGACKQAIEIDREDIHDVVVFDNLYYHTSCFICAAEKRSKRKGTKAAEWKYALERVNELEKEARALLKCRIPYKEQMDKLNDYLLSKYRVVSIQDRFWQTLGDLNNGVYKGKQHSKVSAEMILEVWEWAQKKLDDINRNNKANNRGPTDDNQRLRYDFAIVVNCVPDYLEYKKKQEAEEMERRINRKEVINIDYSKIKTVTNKEGLDDISSLLDELI